MIALHADKPFAVHALLQLKADANYSAPDGARPAHMAVQSGNTLLLEMLTKPTLFGQNMHSTAPPLIKNCRTASNLKKFRLVDLGRASGSVPADLRQKLPGGQTALILAAQVNFTIFFLRNTVVFLFSL